MNATILSSDEKHYPVLLNEILSIISPQNGGTFIDCTFGHGGYSRSILKYPKTKVIAIDRDINSKKNASDLLTINKTRFKFLNKKFSEIDKLDLNNENLRGVIFDLGFSFSQIKNSDRGLSFHSKGPLDMRMGINEFSADEVINKLDQKDLELIFKYFGEDSDSKKISKNIIRERKKNRINTPKLVEIINYSKKKNNKKTHNATKIFQALRIFVNKEISELIYGLINSVKILEKGGFIVVVTFHSLEDRIVKYFFKSLSEKKKISRYYPDFINQKKILELSTKKPILPSETEIKKNQPSRSAKLRYANKIQFFENFEEDFIKKFQNLLQIESLSKKL